MKLTKEEMEKAYFHKGGYIGNLGIKLEIVSISYKENKSIKSLTIKCVDVSLEQMEEYKKLPESEMAINDFDIVSYCNRDVKRCCRLLVTPVFKTNNISSAFVVDIHSGQLISEENNQQFFYYINYNMELKRNSWVSAEDVKIGDIVTILPSHYVTLPF